MSGIVTSSRDEVRLALWRRLQHGSSALAPLVATLVRYRSFRMASAAAMLAAALAILKDQYRTRVATSGAKALEHAGAPDKPDLILLDVTMPDMDGYEVCGRLKADPETASIPVVFLTARTEAEDEAKGFELGAVDYIHKPFNPTVVRARVHTHLLLRDTLRQIEERNAALDEKTRMLESLSVKLSKYLSPQVYASIFTGSRDVELATERKRLTVFFSDIKDFTATTADMQPEDLTAMLNRYFTAMSKIALAYGAHIDKFIGDAMLMFFGDPETERRRRGCAGLRADGGRDAAADGRITAGMARERFRAALRDAGRHQYRVLQRRQFRLGRPDGLHDHRRRGEPRGADRSGRRSGRHLDLLSDLRAGARHRARRGTRQHRRQGHPARGSGFRGGRPSRRSRSRARRRRVAGKLDALLAFYDFPAEHWKHLRTTNPIESTFATIRARTIRSKGCLSNKTALAMVFKLVEGAQNSWRRIDGPYQLPKLIQGIRFTDGIEVVGNSAAPQAQAGA